MVQIRRNFGLRSFEAASKSELNFTNFIGDRLYNCSLSLCSFEARNIGSGIFSTDSCKVSLGRVVSVLSWLKPSELNDLLK